MPGRSREEAVGTVAEQVEALAGRDLRALITRARDAFAAHRDELDALNVFPVPDGDTGTNLLLTVRGAGDGAATGGSPEAWVRGAVMAARGNSGVILSQVLRGLAEGIAARGRLGPAELAEALALARDHAYDAVAEPVEGTMLTAIRVAAERAAQVETDELRDLTAEVLTAVRDAVVRTREQLPVLREAGVVDAGARGFEVFWECLHHEVCGDGAEATARGPAVERAEHVVVRERRSDAYRYEVQYLLDAPPDAATALRGRLERIGDSVVVSGTADLLNVHVHTDDIGAAIEESLVHGRPSRVQVTSLIDRGVGARPAVEVGVGCVAVVPGDGLRRLVGEHGATTAAGTAGALPAVADLLEAVGRTPGERVVMLPGHPNVVATARQAGEVSAAEGGRELHVVGAATSPTRVLAALAVWDPGGDVGDVLEAMDDAASIGSSGEVVPAVRSARTPIGEVRAGDLLVVRDGEVIAATDDAVAALLAAFDACARGEPEIVTLVVGADVPDPERERAVAALEAVAAGAALEVVDGGQRPARYHIGVT